MKKLTSIVLSAAMLLSAPISSMPFEAIHAELSVCAADAAVSHIWDGTADTSWYDEEETSFEISTPEELAGLVELSGKGYTMEGQTITLTADLYLNDVSNYSEWKTDDKTLRSWKQVPTFSGVFDGGEHTIYGLYQYGLFRDVMGGTVKNLNVEQALLFTAGGTICQKNENGSIINCNVRGRISQTGIESNRYCYGGIAGINYGTILFCKNYVEIDLQFSKIAGEETCGGICGLTSYGYSYESSDKTYRTSEGMVIGCSNHGSIKIQNQNAGTPEIYEGGITGWVYGRNKNSFEIKNIIIECCNYGDIYFNASSPYAIVIPGGIAGSFRGGFGITNCYNRANITVNGFMTEVGQAYQDSTEQYDPGIGWCENVNKSYSTGTITHTNKNKTTEYTDAHYYTEDGTQTVKSLANMKKQSFADSLGKAYVYVEGDYPILVWEQFSGYANFDPDIVHLEKLGQQETPSLTTSYSATPKYMSADTDIATVDENGVVTATGRGETEIYAIYADQTATCLIQNYSDTYQLNTEELSVEKGKTKDLYFISDFDNEKLDGVEARFTSDKPAVATVDKATGKVTGVSYGSCKITATEGQQKYICEVTVTEPTAEPTEPTTEQESKYSLSAKTLSIATGKTQEISVVGSAGTVKWMSSDPKIASIKGNGLKATVTGVAQGTTTIYAILTSGQTLECEVTVTGETAILGDVTDDGVFSVADIIALQKWLLGTGKLAKWENADFNKDGIIDIFDLGLMKRALLKNKA